MAKTWQQASIFDIRILVKFNWNKIEIRIFFQKKHTWIPFLCGIGTEAKAVLNSSIFFRTRTGRFFS